MVTILRRLWGDDIHVINPALSLQASPLAKGSAQAAGSVQYLQALRPWTPLKKPVVMLVAQPQMEQRSRSSTVTVNAWRTIVIVPQNYKPPEGKPVGNNENPLMYYFDPQKQLAPNQAPAEIIGFCQVLMRGCQVPAMYQGRVVQIRVEPVFKQLGFLHGCRDICSESLDSSWWALYFAIMAVSYGGVSFVEADRLSLSRLQTVLGSALIEPVQSLETSPPTSASSSSSTTMTTTSTSDIPTDLKTIVQSTSCSSTIPSLKLTDPTTDPAELKSKTRIPVLKRKRKKSMKTGGAYHRPFPHQRCWKLLCLRYSKKQPENLPEYKYNGPAYTPAIMAGILRAYQIASPPDQIVP